MIKREPVIRKAIKLPVSLKYKLKLGEIEAKEKNDNIIDISKHYNMLARRQLGKPGYNSLSIKNPTEHKNWKYFEYMYELCRIKGWNPNKYLEVQFSAYEKFGEDKPRIPYPHGLCSDNAIRGYIRYLGDMKQKYGKDIQGDRKKRGTETLNLNEEIWNFIESSIELLEFYLNTSRTGTPEQRKATLVYELWTQLSPYYLWSIPWFHTVTETLTGIKADELHRIFNMIESSPYTQTLIKDAVSSLERTYNIPDNLQF